MPPDFRHGGIKNYENLEVMLLSYHYFFERGRKSKTYDSELIIKSHSFDDY